MAAVDEVMMADATYHGAHMPNGVANRENWRQAVSRYRTAFPDSHGIYDELIATGDIVVGRWTATGTHTGALPGVETTDNPIAIGGITIYRITDGKIVEAWEQLDLLGWSPSLSSGTMRKSETSRCRWNSRREKPLRPSTHRSRANSSAETPS